MSYQQPSAAIDLEFKFFPLAFLLLLFKPVVEVDGGQPTRMTWGQARIPVAPGRHQIVAYCPYLFFRRMGEAAIVLDVAPGQAVQATWTAPWLVFLSGKWASNAPAPGAPQPMFQQPTAPPVAATSGPPAGWHPDPHGRYQLRYWDGQTWTSHVSTNGQTGVDPVA